MLYEGSQFILSFSFLGNLKPLLWLYESWDRCYSSFCESPSFIIFNFWMIIKPNKTSSPIFNKYPSFTPYYSFIKYIIISEAIFLEEVFKVWNISTVTEMLKKNIIICIMSSLEKAALVIILWLVIITHACEEGCF